MTGVGGHGASTSSRLTLAIEMSLREAVLDGIGPSISPWPWEGLDGPDNAEETCYAALSRTLRGS